LPLRKDSDNASLKCYLGIAYLAAGHAEEAKMTFDTIVNDDHSLFKEVAEWNLAMTYLKLDDDGSLKKCLMEAFSKVVISIINRLKMC